MVQFYFIEWIKLNKSRELLERTELNQLFSKGKIIAIWFYVYFLNLWVALNYFFYLRRPFNQMHSIKEYERNKQMCEIKINSQGSCLGKSGNCKFTHLDPSLPARGDFLKAWWNLPVIRRLSQPEIKMESKQK